MDITTKEEATPFLFEDIKSSERPEVVLANAPKFRELSCSTNVPHGSQHKTSCFK